MMKLFAVAYSFPNYSDISFLLSIILGAILVVFSDVFAFMFLKKKSSAVAHSILSALALASFAIGLYPLNFILLAVVGGYAITIAVTNINEIRINILNFIKGNNNPFKRSQKQPEALFDRDAMYGMINEAVLWFSRTKTCALITFEKRDPLDPFITTGVAINAPVSAEILETIFYEGTRLHDGAVIIRNNMIVSAACLYQPSTKPVAGKMGLRHRAAMGISQNTDSVTIVVSEETGRISIAYDGELQVVHSNDFLRIFEEYMALTKNPDEGK